MFQRERQIPARLLRQFPANRHENPPGRKQRSAVQSAAKWPPIPRFNNNLMKRLKP